MKVAYNQVAKDIPFNIAKRIADELCGKLRRCTVAAMACGDIRRGEKIVNDTSIVIIPNMTQLYLTEDERSLLGQIELRNGKRSVVLWNETDSARFITLRFTIHVATNEDFGAQILSWTGNATFNTKIRGLARSKGYKLNEYGLWRLETDERVAGQTEEEIFACIGMNYVRPHDRSRNTYIGR